MSDELGGAASQILTHSVPAELDSLHADMPTAAVAFHPTIERHAAGRRSKPAATAKSTRPPQPEFPHAQDAQRIELSASSALACKAEICSNSAFRQTVERLGADAAIITFERARPALRRHAYLIGFDQWRSHASATECLLAMADCCWKQLPERQYLHLERSDVQTLLASADGLPQCAATDADSLLASFDHLAFSASAVGSDGRLRMALLRLGNRGPFAPGLEQAIALVQPVLSEIADVQMEAQWAQRRIGILEGMLDSVSHGVILLDPMARPFYANDVARDLMAQTGALAVSADQVLRCRAPEQTQQLHRAIRDSISGRQFGEEIIVKLTGTHGEQLLGFLTPAVGRGNDARNRAAILIIHQMKIHAASPALMRAFGLLPSEQRFLATFLDAPSLGDAAAQLDLSEETARTYLKRICGKLGVRRQVELASMMFGLAPPLRRTAEQACSAAAS